MLLTHQDPEGITIRPIANHGRRKPDPRLVVALVEMHLTDLPANSLRRQILKRMIERTRE